MNGYKTTADDWVKTKLRLLGNNASSLDLMQLSVSENRYDVVEALIAGKYRVNGDTLAHAFALGGHAEFINAAVELAKGFDEYGQDIIRKFIDTKNDNGDMPIHLAAGHGPGNKGYIEVVELLLKNGAKVNAKGLNGCTPIYRAAQCGKVGVLNYLLKYVEDNFGKDEVLHAILDLNNDGHSPLWSAVMFEHIECIESLCNYLKKYGKKVDDIEIDGGQTLLFSAVINDKIKSIKRLVDSGADINAKCGNGATPIFAAATESNPDTIRYLNKELKVDIKGLGKKFGATPLAMAAATGKLANIDCLVDLGADVNELTDSGQTAIFAAAMHGQVAAMERLKKYGAKFGIKDKSGRTVIDIALHNGRPEAAKWLRANKERKWVFAVIFIIFVAIAAVLALYFIPEELNNVFKQNQKIAEQSESDDEDYFGYFKDSRDGQEYRTIEIGDITWLERNLNYKPRSGGSWCYNNVASNCNRYGRLYDWNTATTVCPTEWRLPTRQEWKYLVTVTGGDAAGTMLKKEAGWVDDGNGTNDYLFSALPGGSRAADGSFKNLGNRGLWWTATEYDADSAYYRRMGYNYDHAYEGTYDKENGFSVRCVQ